MNIKIEFENKLIKNCDVLLGCAIFGYTVAMSCDQCGQECTRACGTRHFRSCCFNYVRKRSSSPMIISPNHINDEISKKQSSSNQPGSQVSCFQLF